MASVADLPEATESTNDSNEPFNEFNIPRDNDNDDRDRDGHRIHRLFLVLSLVLPFLTTQDLARLARVSKPLYSIAGPDVFNHVNLTNAIAAVSFCDAIRRSHRCSNCCDDNNDNVGSPVEESRCKNLGHRVRTLELRFSTPASQQPDIETHLLDVIPSMSRMSVFQWLLEFKPFSDDIWRKLGLHCAMLRTIDVASLNGLRPSSSFFHLKNLEELRVRSWSSDFDPTARLSLLCSLPFPEDIFSVSKHPLIDMLISRNTGLKSLELNISTSAVAFAPPIGSLCKILYTANWHSLKELIIKFSLYGSSHPVVDNDNADAAQTEDLPAFGEILTRFLSSHPTIEILRLSSGSLLPPLPPLNLITSGTSASPYASAGLEEAYLAMPAPYCMFISPQLPDSALPNLKTFEGSCVEDLKIICRPQACRSLTTLPAVEGWIIPETLMTTAASTDDGSTGTSSVNPSNTPPPSTAEISSACQITISNLAKTLANLHTLSAIAIRLRGASIKRNDLRLLTSSVYNVKHLILDVQWEGRPNDVTSCLGSLPNLESVELDVSFLPAAQNGKQFSQTVALACAALRRVSFLRAEQRGEAKKHFEIRWAKNKVKKRRRDGGEGHGEGRAEGHRHRHEHRRERGGGDDDGQSNKRQKRESAS